MKSLDSDLSAYINGKSSSSQSTLPLKRCDHSMRVAFYVKPGQPGHAPVRFIPVDSSGMKETYPYADAVIDLAGTAPKGADGAWIESNEDSFSRTMEMVASPRYMRMKWVDMGIPPSWAGVIFWRTLLGDLATIDTMGGDVLVAVGCIGGHGRTGTFLASILISVCNMGADDAVEFVRKHHCTKAVESSTQKAYLDQLEKQAATLPAAP